MMNVYTHVMYGKAYCKQNERNRLIWPYSRLANCSKAWIPAFAGMTGIRGKDKGVAAIIDGKLQLKG